MDNARDMEFVVGQVYHPYKKVYWAVVGHEFYDSPGFYQFYRVGKKGNFRKKPTADDTLHPICYNVYAQIKDEQE